MEGANQSCYYFNMSDPTPLFGMATGITEQTDDEFDNIWVACTNGDIAKVQKFLEAGIDINVQDEHGNSPIHSAASYSQLELLEFLIQQGADVNLKDSDNETPIMLTEDQKTFELLERHGANPRDMTNDKAMELASDDNEDMVSYLYGRKLIPLNFKMMTVQNDYGDGP